MDTHVPDTTINTEAQMQKTLPMWQNKKIFAISIFVLIVLGLILISLGNKTPVSQTLLKIYPTPTSVALPPNAYQHLLITVSPDDGSSDNSLFATIAATFSRPLSSSEKAYVKMRVQPNIPGEIVWSSARDKATFIPSVHLLTSTTYTVTLSYGSSSKEWSFTTVSDSAVSQEDQNNIQLQSDDLFGKWQSNLYSSYAWYDSLPLQTSDYYTYFDVNSKTFISDLYVSPTDKGKIQSLKQEVIQQLQSLGIDTSTYKLVWNITP
jgi:hypothetical protein